MPKFDYNDDAEHSSCSIVHAWYHIPFNRQFVFDCSCLISHSFLINTEGLRNILFNLSTDSDTLNDDVTTPTSPTGNDAETIELNFVVDQKNVSLMLKRNENIPSNTPVYLIENGTTTRWNSPSGQVIQSWMSERRKAGKEAGVKIAVLSSAERLLSLSSVGLGTDGEQDELCVFCFRVHRYILN